ncbi:uncharacterized protein LOC134744893 [Cydia strobilella]|uniref:uncharacterized protein LOC134744893 n=1 Tax=Cydia strobilella TaxID=1100964 RepID=UPI003003FE5D
MAEGVEQLKKFLQNIAKKENYLLSKIDIKPISSGGANYTTDLYLATISEPLKPDINIFAKAANLNEDARKNNEFLCRVYETEALFYSELVVNFERLYNKRQVPLEERLYIPKCYGHLLVPYEEILVLENLEAKGFKNFDRMKTFDWDYASTAVTQLAKFHALGLALRDENPHEFTRIVGNFKLDLSESQELMNMFLTFAIENGSEAVRSDHKERLQKFFTSTENIATLMTMMTNDEIFLVHGDYRPSNLMHRRCNGKLEIVPLDYQTLKSGSPVADLMHFVFSGSDAEFRRLHYQRLMDHYFTQLTLALQQLNVDVEKLYPRETFDADLIKMRPLGLFLGLSIAGMLTVAPEEAPKLDGDMSKIRIKPNQLALERINGIVEDYVRWGERRVNKYTMAKGVEQLKIFLQNIAKKENYLISKIDIKPISSGGANYTTDLYLATISEPLKPDINIFAKAANLNEDARKNDFLSRVYETEALFYSELAVNFERLYNECQVPVEDRLYIPKYYGHLLVPYEEILVLENLEAKGFKSFDRMKTFNWDYASTAVTQLAKFHALGLALRDENPNEFTRIVGNFKFDLYENQEMMNAFLKLAIENVCEGLNSDHKERLQKFFASTENIATLMAKMTKGETFLTHGDYRPSNLMHRRRNGKLEVVPLLPNPKEWKSSR